jgi:hypothetical protein
MNTTILFFLIGFASSLVGFVAGYLAGEKTADLLDGDR